MYQRRTVVWNTLYHGQLSASLSRLLRSATNNTLPTSKGQIDGTNSVTISRLSKIASAYPLASTATSKSICQLKAQNRFSKKPNTQNFIQQWFKNRNL